MHMICQLPAIAVSCRLRTTEGLFLSEYAKAVKRGSNILAVAHDHGAQPAAYKELARKGLSSIVASLGY